MATYKVLQDIEAEDKFLGPLTLKQFIFMCITVVSGYLAFIFLTKGLWVLVFPLVPVMLVFGFLAFPWGRDQPTEVWLLAKIRFMFKPRKRIWDQTGVQELVKITAPPVVEQFSGDDLSQTEVKSRLKALAETIDSRGWVVKNVTAHEYASPEYGIMSSTANGSDRLISASTLPKTNPMNIDVGFIDDIFDNPKAEQLTAQLAQFGEEHRQDTVEHMRDIATEDKSKKTKPDLWFMNEPPKTSEPGMATFGTTVVSSDKSKSALPDNFKSKNKVLDPKEVELSKSIKQIKDKPNEAFRHLKTLIPPSDEKDLKPLARPVTPPADPVTMRLARNNDRPIDSLARESNKAHQQPDDGEVVISLH